jgi:hypothetical protein
LKLPPVGKEIIGYKKVCDAYGGGVIVQLRIPPEARRVCAQGMLDFGCNRKCRAEYAEVVGMFTRGYEIITDGSFRSIFSRFVTYALGEVVKPDRYDPDESEACSSGIHFFLTLEEAEAYW